MLLSKLELKGFKSFAKQVELQFDKGITGIVGPNGSGKSNIADALRWVLGEQSAKSLRGGRMEDIIFNGSDAGKAQAYCEATVSFDNTDNGLPLDFSEISVTRRVYRSGDGEYLINKNACRLKDVVELFRDTGIGKEGYSIIGQGRVDEILSSRDEDRRAVFEEAAGVAKYRARKEEAERKLEKTHENILRIGDILAEIEGQLMPLEKQSATAKAYLELKEELKGVELASFLTQYDGLNGRILQHDQLYEQLLAEAGELEKQTDVGTLELEDRTGTVRRLDTVIATLQHDLIELTGGVEKQSGEANVISERVANLTKTAAQLAEQEGEQTLVLAEGQKSIKALSAQSLQKERVLTRRKAELEEACQILSAHSARLEKAESELESLKSSVIDKMNNLSNAKVQAGRLEEMLKQLDMRRQGMEGEAQKDKAELDSLETELGQAQRELENLNDRKKEQQEEKARLDLAARELRQLLESTEEEWRKLERELDAVRSRWKVLGEMKTAYEGYYASVKGFMRDASRQPELKKGIVGVVAELFTVPKELETAIEMTLGSAVQNIVTEDENSARKAIEYLRSRNYGRATFLPMTAVKPRLLTDGELRMVSGGVGVVGVAAELVGCKAEHKGIIDNLLGRTVIVEDLPEGIALAKKTGHGFRIATLKGDIINPGGSMTGGSVQKKEFSLLGRGREIDELRNRLVALSGEIEARKAQNDANREGLALKLEQIGQTDDCLHAIELDLTRNGEKADMLTKLKAQHRKASEENQEELERIGQTLADVQGRLDQWADAQQKLESGRQATQEDVTKAQQLMYEAREKKERAAEAVNGLRLGVAGLEHEFLAISADIKRLRDECAAIEKRLEKDRESQQKSLESAQSLKLRTEQMNREIAQRRAVIDQCMAQLNEHEENRESAKQAQERLEEHISRIREKLAEINEKRHRSELLRGKAQVELEALQDRIWQDYEMTYDAAREYSLRARQGATQKRVEELKTAIRQLGDVNVNAIEDYKSTLERFTSLSTQQTDLEAAEADLRRLIEQLVTTMQAKFKESFEQINKYFGRSFNGLFGGGRAEARLSDPGDVMNSAIEIIAQPPGKKLQLLSLLSGGERALTAIALLFAMLELKPTPFCVMDEIESSLDEANVDNFAAFLRRYASKTQFILITHRKGSMAVCDNLYGVAMVDKGVSGLVSVKLAQEEIEKEVV